ncbi:MAG: hypothetical protein ACI8Z9_002113 [Paraglaciecola sp.]|jgi:uncharacterized protein (DUF1330 family)
MELDEHRVLYHSSSCVINPQAAGKFYNKQEWYDIVSQLTIDDRSKYEEYENGFAEVLQKYDCQMLSVDEGPIVLARKRETNRSAIIQYPSNKSPRVLLIFDAYQAISK